MEHFENIRNVKKLFKWKAEEVNELKTALLIAGVIFLAGINFVTYCCLRMASQEDEYLEKMYNREEQENEIKEMYCHGTEEEV